MIALDVHVIGGQETGNETYTLNLTRALLKVAPDRVFALLTPHPERLPSDLMQAANAQVIRDWPDNHLIRVSLSLPYSLWRSHAGLLHVNYILPPLCPCPGVATVHDLSYELLPKDAPPRDRLVLGTLLPISARQAAAIIVVSQNTLKDVVERLHVPQERITVIYEAAPPYIERVTDRALLDRVLRCYRMTSPYILAVGNLQPRKNLLRVVEAYAAIQHEDPSVQLVIVGKARWRQSEIIRLVRERGLENRVIFTGYVSNGELSALYSAAAVLIYPSLYEGFGLPVLEAMTCGTPVITSNSSSLPEVAGDAALLIDPRNVAALVAALRAVLTSSDLAGDLRARGLKQARLFSWQKTAEQTLAVYDRVLGQKANDRSR